MARNRNAAQGIIGVVLIVGLCGVIGAIWLLSGYNPPERRRPRLEVLANGDQTFKYVSKAPTRAMLMGGAPTLYMPGQGYNIGVLRTPQAVPRYYANLTTTVGDYIVSVRQVADFEQGMSLYENSPSVDLRPPLFRLNISLQVMTSSPDAMQRIKEFAPALTVTDDKGTVQQTGAASNIATFPNGMARTLNMPPPAEGARYYRSIEGTLIIRQDDGTEKPLPFTLQNIPLPKENHLFGLAATSLLPNADNSLNAEGQGIIQGEAAYAYERNFPPFAPESGILKLPNRLILLAEMPNRFQVALPTPQGEMPLTATLTPHLLPGSRAKATLRLEAEGNPAKPLEWNLEAWENEPLIVTFKASHFFPNLTQTAGFRLFLYSRPLSETYPTISPIRPDKVTQSGALVVQAQIEDRPLRFGTARIEMVQRLGEFATRGEAIIQLDDNGIGRINNVPPGDYEVTLKELQPYHNHLTPLKDGTQALLRRYQLTQPRITAQVQKTLRLRPGGELKLQTWRVTEGKIAQK